MIYSTKDSRNQSSQGTRGASAARKTSKQWCSRKKKVRRIDGVRSTLYNPIPEQFGEPKIIDSLKDIFKEYEDMQINSIVPETNGLANWEK